MTRNGGCDVLIQLRIVGMPELSLDDRLVKRRRRRNHSRIRLLERGAGDSALLEPALHRIAAVRSHIGRYPTTLELEDRSDALHWSLAPPESRSDVREAIERGDLKAGSWRRSSWTLERMGRSTSRR